MEFTVQEIAKSLEAEFFEIQKSKLLRLQNPVWHLSTI